MLHQMIEQSLRNHYTGIQKQAVFVPLKQPHGPFGVDSSEIVARLKSAQKLTEGFERLPEVVRKAYAAPLRYMQDTFRSQSKEMRDRWLKAIGSEALNSGLKGAAIGAPITGIVANLIAPEKKRRLYTLLGILGGGLAGAAIAAGPDAYSNIKEYRNAPDPIALYDRQLAAAGVGK